MTAMLTLVLGLFMLGPSQERASAGEAERGARPNVVLVLVDDLGWRDLGVTGSDFHHTPNLDRLAGEGMLFEQAYAAASNCTPSRACILTGLYTPRTGIYSVAGSLSRSSVEPRLQPVASRGGLAPELRTIPEVLAPGGYRSGFFGKWHLAGRVGDSTPTSQGFDVEVGSGGGLVSYFSPYGNRSLADAPPGEYLTTRLTSEALAFAEACGAEPFFIHLAYYAVHTVRGKHEVEPRPEFLEATAGREPGRVHTNRSYAAMVEGLDHEVGRLLAGLERLGLADDTLVLFTSDNGGAAGLTEMAPLRGSKGMLTEGGLRVPLIARWPGRIAPGSRCSEPVIGVDLLPTIAAACGVTADAVGAVDGVDLGPLLLGVGGLRREALFWHFPTYLPGDGSADIGPWRAKPSSVVRSGRHKLLQHHEDGALELYDLEADPGESRNLAAEEPELAARLCALLAAWRAEVDAPLAADAVSACEPR